MRGSTFPPESPMDSVIIKRDRVRLAANSNPGAPAGESHEKSVRAIESGGRVTGIEFVCSCGERTLVELIYDSGGATPRVESPSRSEPDSKAPA